VHDHRGVGAGEVERPGVQRRQRYQVELERRDDTQRPLAAAHPPEQLGLVDRCHPAGHAVAGDDLDGAYAVGSPAEGPGDRAQPTAGGVADDAHAGGGAAQRGQTVRGGRVEHLLPAHPGADPRPPVGVHHALVEAPGVHEDRAVERAGQAVPGGLHGDRPSGRGGEAHGLGDIPRVAGFDDGRGCRGDRDVESGRQLGVERLSGHGECPGEPATERLEGFDGGGHGGPFRSAVWRHRGL
jgi:hypothetical protein